MTISHLAACLARRAVDLRDPGLASRIWRGLRRGFPDALAAVLMLDHVHVLDEGMAPAAARRRLAQTLSRATYGLGRGVWDAVPLPDGVHESKLARTIRYVALNPCRKGLVADPLEWVWSTHRDVMGAVADPWVPAERLAMRLGPFRWDSRGEWHRYVSSDFAVAFRGTPAPLSARGAAEATAGSCTRPPLRLAADSPCGPTHTLMEIAEAVATALRISPAAVRTRGPARNLFVHLARRQGWRDSSVIAAAGACTRRSVNRLTGIEPAREALAAAAICLGDARLRAGEPSRVSRPDSGHRRQDGRPSPPGCPDSGRPRRDGRAGGWGDDHDGQCVPPAE